MMKCALSKCVMPKLDSREKELFLYYYFEGNLKT